MFKSCVSLNGVVNMLVNCKRCNRPLKNLKNQEIGFGKICLAKHNEELTKIIKDAEMS